MPGGISFANSSRDWSGEHGPILMVGHILEYHPARLERERLVRTGELGRIRDFYCSYRCAAAAAGSQWKTPLRRCRIKDLNIK